MFAAKFSYFFEIKQVGDFVGRGGRDGKEVRKIPYIILIYIPLAKSRTAREMEM